MKKFFPILEWFPKYNSTFLKKDAIAGITVGVVLIPQGIAYAMIAGLPPIYGLYTALIPQIIYALLGTAPRVAVGPVAMDSL
ncbi:SulP family inorganic anion transporter, partial [Bacteroidota bacterium]